MTQIGPPRIPLDPTGSWNRPFLGYVNRLKTNTLRPIHRHQLQRTVTLSVYHSCNTVGCDVSYLTVETWDRDPVCYLVDPVCRICVLSGV